VPEGQQYSGSAHGENPVGQVDADSVGRVLERVLERVLTRVLAGSEVKDGAAEEDT